MARQVATETAHRADSARMARATGRVAEVVCAVRSLVKQRMTKVESSVGAEGHVPSLTPGKMLRTSYGARLAVGGRPALKTGTLERLCAAVEIVHTASLCHDDVIDCGQVRRSLPTLWKRVGTTGAVLIGDLLLCEAMELLVQTEGGAYVPAFVAKVCEMCAAEARQEFWLQGKRPDQSTCLEISRRKTGPLFAFIGRACGGADDALAAALEEVGYRIGTAYQLADDLLDSVGSESNSGKTLGMDLARGKFTIANLTPEGPEAARRLTAGMCHAALQCVDRWAGVRNAVREFLLLELQPVFTSYDISVDLRAELPA